MQQPTEFQVYSSIILTLIIPFNVIDLYLYIEICKLFTLFAMKSGSPLQMKNGRAKIVYI